MEQQKRGAAADLSFIPEASPPPVLPELSLQVS